LLIFSVLNQGSNIQLTPQHFQNKFFFRMYQYNNSINIIFLKRVYYYYSGGLVDKSFVKITALF